MPLTPRPRRRFSLLPAALTALLAVALTACASGNYPNSVFTNFTEFNRDIGYLFKILIWLGTIVFVLVEALLIYTLVRFRKREGQAEPQHVHGNTTLEILWTVIPAVILVFIAIPTVRTIFKTQAKAKPDALVVEVVGHQWWWEFRYPQYTTAGLNGKVDTLVTANELYLPLGRTVNFHLKTQDVLHSFWVPQLGGKRDLIANHTNFLWFTPDSTTMNAWNGFCVEYCGASHANMRFRAYTVAQADFQSWVAHQLTPAQGFPGVPGTPVPAAGTQPALGAGTPPGAGAAAATTNARTTGSPQPATAVAPNTALPGQAPAAATAVSFVSYPREQLHDHNVPKKTPDQSVRWSAATAGDAARGQGAFLSGGCIGCHAVRGNAVAVGIVGPNLSHFATRHTIAAGLYPNDAEHLGRWIKNARKLKPGSLMPTLGKGEIDPQTGKVTTTSLLDDQQIADIVAYLYSLK